jgi:DNA-binding protein H-NS
MASGKTGSTLAALNAQIAALQAQAKSARDKEVAAIIAQAKDAIAHYGLTASDLGLDKASRKAGKPSTTATAKFAAKPGKKAAGKKGPKVVKFKDDQGNTWGGIGKRPQWFNAALAAGKKPEDLLANR